MKTVDANIVWYTHVVIEVPLSMKDEDIIIALKEQANLNKKELIGPVIHECPDYPALVE